MGTLTLLTTVMAVVALLKGDYTEHRGWMVRSYTMLWTSSVGFRLAILLVLPSGSASVGPLPDSFKAPYTATVFITPLLGLLLADAYLYFARRRVAALGPGLLPGFLKR